MSKIGRQPIARGAHRLVSHEASLIAAVLVPERSVCAEVVYVSADAARLRGCKALKVGQDLWIKVGVIDRLATVSGREGDLCDIHFDEPLSEDDLCHLRAEARNMLVTRLSRAERLAAKEWIDGFVC